MLSNLSYHSSRKYKDTVVIADGAAFGAEIADLAEAQKQSPNKIAIFLPESFEWLILKSGLVDVSDTRKLDEAYDYADSVEYMSWEQYFTKILVDLTKENKLKKVFEIAAFQVLSAGEICECY